MVKLRSVRLEGHVSCIGEKLNAYRALVAKRKVKDPFGSPTPRS
jgi:hypothetical protein